VVLKTASRGDLTRGFESHALRLTFGMTIRAFPQVTDWIGLGRP